MNQPTSINELLEQVRHLKAEVDAATAQQRHLREEERAARADQEDALATRRRNGELGRDWQVLQQRIDMNRTTLDDVLTGVDTSAEARAVRKTLQQEAIPRARAEFAAAMKSEEAAGHLDDLRDAQAQLQQALASVQRARGGR